MLEKDQFEQFLSDAFANQTEAVRPDLWSGVQSKMASAGVTSTVAAKSVSILTKWIFGSIAVGSAATIFALVLFNNNENPKSEELAPSPSKNIEYTSETEKKNISSKNEIVSSSKNSDQKENDLVLISVKPTLIGCAIQSFANVVDELEENKTTIISELKTEKTTTGTTTGSDEENHVVAVNENSTTTEPEQIIEEPEVKKDENPIIISKVTKFPDIFTPNGDGANDYYFIEVQNISNFHVSIMNLKNEIVYESSDPHFKWDGSVRNEIQKSGQFACIVTGTDNEGKSFKDIQLFVIR